NAHLHTFEESVYVMEGQLVVETGDGRFGLNPGDYGVVHVAAPHAIRNMNSTVVRWAEMQAPQPRAGKGGDVYSVVVPFSYDGDPILVDARDPRTRFFGNITTQHMDPTRQSQE